VNLIQEAQRQLRNEIFQASIFATNGISHSSYDQCHYNYANGYKLMGDYMFNLVNRDLYNAPDPGNIESPAVNYAAQIAANKIKLYLKNQTDTYIWEAATENEFRIEGSTTRVVSGTVVGPSIVLTLSVNVSSVKGISYRGHRKKASPAIRNLSGAGMVGFYNLPVSSLSSLASNKVLDENRKIIFTIFPNPANSIITIQYTLHNTQKLRLSIVDLNGRKLIENDLSEQTKCSGINVTKVDVSKLAKGLYLVQLQSSYKYSVQKLIKK
ncbi:MAG: T9SS type A sorting domain-containing protein, partial [Parafilimonas sp.]